MSTDSTTDLRFLTELVRLADQGASHIAGRGICGAIGAEETQADALVSRLIARGLIEKIGPSRLADKQGRFNIRPTAAAYRLVGHGLVGE